MPLFNAADFNSSDLDFGPAPTTKSHPRAGLASIERIVEDAEHDRIASKKRVKQLTFGHGAPTTRYSQALWVNRFEAYRQHSGKDKSAVFTCDELIRFFTSTFGGDEEQKKLKFLPGKPGVTVVYAWQASKLLIEYGHFYWPTFQWTRHDQARLKTLIGDLTREGRLTSGTWHSRTWIGFVTLSRIVRGYLEHCLNYGTRSWDQAIARCLGVTLVASLGCRSGDVARSDGYTGEECMQYRHIELYLVDLAGGVRVTLDNVRAIVTIPYAKGFKDRANDNQVKHLRPLVDASVAHVDPIRLLLVHALRHGLVEGGTTLQQVLDAAARRPDRRVVWIRPDRPILPAFRNSGGPARCDLDTAAGSSQLLTNVKTMGLAAGVLDRVYMHAVRAGAARDVARLAATDLVDEPAQPALSADQVRQSLGHSHHAASQGVTDRYVGEMETDLYSARAGAKLNHLREPRFAPADVDLLGTLAKRPTVEEKRDWEEKMAARAATEAKREAKRARDPDEDGEVQAGHTGPPPRKKAKTATTKKPRSPKPSDGRGRGIRHQRLQQLQQDVVPEPRRGRKPDAYINKPSPLPATSVDVEAASPQSDGPSSALQQPSPPPPLPDLSFILDPNLRREIEQQHAQALERYQQALRNRPPTPSSNRQGKPKQPRQPRDAKQQKQREQETVVAATHSIGEMTAAPVEELPIDPALLDEEDLLATQVPEGVLDDLTRAIWPAGPDGADGAAAGSTPAGIDEPAEDVAVWDGVAQGMLEDEEARLLLADTGASQAGGKAAVPELSSWPIPNARCCFVDAYASVNLVKNSAPLGAASAKHQADEDGSLEESIGVDGVRGNSRDDPMPFYFVCRVTLACPFRTTRRGQHDAHEKTCSEQEVQTRSTLATGIQNLVDGAAPDDEEGADRRCPREGCPFVSVVRSTAKKRIRDSVMAHVRGNHDFEPKPCEHGCAPDHIYQSLGAYNWHMASRHDPRFPAKCRFPNCDEDKDFGSVGELAAHLERDHKLVDQNTRLPYMPESQLMVWKSQRCVIPGCYALTEFPKPRGMVDHLQCVHGMSKDDAQARVERDGVLRPRAATKKRTSGKMSLAALAHY